MKKNASSHLNFKSSYSVISKHPYFKLILKTGKCYGLNVYSSTKLMLNPNPQGDNIEK